jgi:hypothetical protein
LNALPQRAFREAGIRNRARMATSRRAHGGVSERRGAQRYVDYDRFYPNLVVEIEIRNEFSILQILVEVEVFSALREDCPLQG